MGSCSERVFIMTSTSHPDTTHQVTYHPTTNNVTCDCPGFRFHGYCKHIEFYKNNWEEANKK